MDDFTRALDSLLRVIVLLGDLIVARIQVIELWIRMRFDSWGLPPQVQTALLVTAAVVVARAEGGDGPELCGYWTGDAEPNQVRESLARQLPRYLVPAFLTRLAQLPLTSSGKTDRRALPAPDRTLAGRSGMAYTAPRQPIEREIARLWCEVLRLDRVGVHDNFFEVGGHSLHLLELQSRIEQTLKIRIELHEFFTLPTIEALAKRCAGHSTESRTDVRVQHRRAQQARVQEVAERRKARSEVLAAP